MRKSPQSKKLTQSVLSHHSLPVPGSDGDKESRGRVLVVGGEASLPGAVILAGTAALRAGAGKLQLASVSSVSTAIGVAVPESMSIGLRETNGAIHPSAARALREHVAGADALLIGPGTRQRRSNVWLVQSLLDLPTNAAIVLDAAALEVLRENFGALGDHEGNTVLTPHIAEMAMMLSIKEEAVRAGAAHIAVDAAAAFGAVVALKGPTTYIASPAGELFRYEGGDVGLATSGSGDTLAGIVAALLARGAEPLTAALWAVHLHGEAGNVLSQRMGRIGFLARELLDEIPPLMHAASSNDATEMRKAH